MVYSNRVSYICGPVLLNILNEVRRGEKSEGCQAIYCFFATSLIISVTCIKTCLIILSFGAKSILLSRFLV